MFPTFESRNAAQKALFIDRFYETHKNERFVMTDTEIQGWNIAETELSDGSKVYDIIGGSDEAKVTLNCVDKDSADKLMVLLTIQCSGATAEVK